MNWRWFYMVVVLGALSGLTALPAAAGDILTQKATSGRFLAGGFYPDYVLFLKGLDPSTIKTEWVDKPYLAVIDVLEGPEAGKSAVMELVPNSKASPNPQWCRTEGGQKFKGQGITCLAGDPGREQLRYRVRALYADDLPAAFSGRDVVEYPNLPGRREGEVLGAFELHILLD